MAWKKGEKISTNLIVGFLGSGKTTAISKLIQQRPGGEDWSILINEFGTVSIDHALLGSSFEGVAVEELGGGCACCTMAFAFKPLLAQFLRRTKPDRLILEPSGVSHPAKVVDILRSDNFSGVIELRNTICLIDPKDIDDPRWQESEVFQDQVQLADIVVLNWTDSRDRALIDRCRSWVESFVPPKQLIVESSFGVIDPKLLDIKFDTVRFPLFADAHPRPESDPEGSPLVGIGSEASGAPLADEPVTQTSASQERLLPALQNPIRFEDQGAGYQGCGWVFHLDDVFDRNKLLDLIGGLQHVIRVKGIFRCQSDWWMINRAKSATDYSASTYRRDSRLEVILNDNALDWDSFETELLQCLIPND